jgi:hypothetical protein
MFDWKWLGLVSSLLGFLSPARYAATAVPPTDPASAAPPPPADQRKSAPVFEIKPIETDTPQVLMQGCTDGADPIDPLGAKPKNLAPPQ